VFLFRLISLNDIIPLSNLLRLRSLPPTIRHPNEPPMSNGSRCLKRRCVFERAEVGGRESSKWTVCLHVAQALCGAVSSRAGGDDPMRDDQSMSLRFAIVLALSITCLAAPAWADYRAGMDAYGRGDYATALREWQPLAQQGDP